MLASTCPEMARLMELHGPCRLGVRPKASERFASLARAIAFQQLAGAAAGAIWERVVTSIGGECSAESVLAAGEATLRSAGLSGAKTAALLDLANHELAGCLGLGRIGRLSDEAVTERLVQVRGIGPWTAQMFLMFTLHRLDVWPVGDLGVRRGFALAFGLADLPSPAELDAAGEQFRPYRSIAAWYCWRACEQV
jgi:3-methyladenine DNA glycosylase/8-oxoguanine DNA glycosylase